MLSGWGANASFHTMLLELEFVKTTQLSGHDVGGWLKSVGLTEESSEKEKISMFKKTIIDSITEIMPYYGQFFDSGYEYFDLKQTYRDMSYEEKEALRNKSILWFTKKLNKVDWTSNIYNKKNWMKYEKRLTILYEVLDMEFSKLIYFFDYTMRGMKTLGQAFSDFHSLHIIDDMKMDVPAYLREARAKKINDDSCRNDGLEIGWKWHKNNLCISSVQGKNEGGTCISDSGSAVVAKIGGKYTVVAITSTGAVSVPFDCGCTCR